MRSYFAPVRAAFFSAALIGLSVLGTTAAHAQTVIYNTSAAFLAATQAGSYTETFTGTGVTTGGSAAVNASVTGFNFAGNGYTYNINGSGTNGAYRSGAFIGTYNSPATLTITFTSNNVTAFGANFFNTDNADAFLANSPVTLLLNNGTTTTFTPASTSEYRGFTSNIAITSLTFTSATAGIFPSLDNLTVGTRVVAAAAPEPGTLALVGLGAVPLMGVVARRRRKAA